MTMGIDAALESVRNLGVILNDYDSEALAVMCDWVEWKLKQERDEWYMYGYTIEGEQHEDS